MNIKFKHASDLDKVSCFNEALTSHNAFAIIIRMLGYVQYYLLPIIGAQYIVLKGRSICLTWLAMIDGPKPLTG